MPRGSGGGRRRSGGSAGSSRLPGSRAPRRAASATRAPQTASKPSASASWHNGAEGPTSIFQASGRAACRMPSSVPLSSAAAVMHSTSQRARRAARSAVIAKPVSGSFSNTSTRAAISRSRGMNGNQPTTPMVLPAPFSAASSPALRSVTRPAGSGSSAFSAARPRLRARGNSSSDACGQFAGGQRP